MPDGDVPFSPDVLLRHAARGDAERALTLLAYVRPTKLLDAVVTQAELAVDEDHPRPAGIDAIAELDRASIEVMGLPQGAGLELDLDAGAAGLLDLETDGNETDRLGPWGGFTTHGHEDAGQSPPRDSLPPVEASDIVWHPDDESLLDAPVLIGWELTTTDTADLDASVVTLTVRPWYLALVAFADSPEPGGGHRRRIAAAAADGRLIAAELRFDGSTDEPDLLGAVISRDPLALGGAGDLAASLRAALESAGRGIG